MYAILVQLSLMHPADLSHLTVVLQLMRLGLTALHLPRVSAVCCAPGSNARRAYKLSDPAGPHEQRHISRPAGSWTLLPAKGLQTASVALSEATVWVIGI